MTSGSRKMKILPQQYIVNPNAAESAYFGGGRDTTLVMEDEFIQ